MARANPHHSAMTLRSDALAEMRKRLEPREHQQLLLKQLRDFSFECHQHATKRPRKRKDDGTFLKRKIGAELSPEEMLEKEKVARAARRPVGLWLRLREMMRRLRRQRRGEVSRESIGGATNVELRRALNLEFARRHYRFVANACNFWLQHQVPSRRHIPAHWAHRMMAAHVDLVAVRDAFTPRLWSLLKASKSNLGGRGDRCGEGAVGGAQLLRWHGFVETARDVAVSVGPQVFSACKCLVRAQALRHFALKGTNMAWCCSTVAPTIN